MGANIRPSKNTLIIWLQNKTEGNFCPLVLCWSGLVDTCSGSVSSTSHNQDCILGDAIFDSKNFSLNKNGPRLMSLQLALNCEMFKCFWPKSDGH
jgi:hypothetical protein